MMKILLATAMVAMLAGCQTFPQVSTDSDPSRACFNSIPARAELDVLKPKIGSFTDPNAATLEMRSNQSKANDTEKQALSAWASMRMQCIQAGEAFRAAPGMGTYNALITNQNSQFVGLMAKLYSGEWSYSQFIDARIALANESQQRWQDAQRQQQSDDRARQQADAVQQMQLNNSLLLLQAAQPKPQPIAPLRPQVNCTSRNVMGTVQTNCW
ncbi:hypothetical protein [Delftia acidovorans]|uniref:hypothetical protein n=1 Tax=Delftia acidovorans TaxID=80866 RepID=UPI000F8180AD|nr:hypothetical protein [Delftia acidovorans]